MATSWFDLAIISEGGTGEDRMIDPHLKFGTTIVIIFGKVGSDPLLDKKKIPILTWIKSVLPSLAIIYPCRISKCYSLQRKRF